MLCFNINMETLVVSPLNSVKNIDKLLESGANEVYFGLQGSLNSRNFSNLNIPMDYLKKVVNTCHSYGAKSNLVLNSFPTTNKELKSMRDLRSTDIDLINKIKIEGLKMIKEIYGLNENQIKIFFHYPPSTYLLHIHFMHISIYHHGTSFERSHDLYQVIYNLELDTNYYRRDMRIVEVPNESSE